MTTSNGEQHRIDVAIIPGPDTPGFRICSSRAFHVWLSLLHHALKFAHGPHDTKSVQGIWAEWTVDAMSRSCGVSRNAGGRALRELTELGWVRCGLERHASGQYSGFRFCLCEPPRELTESGKRRQCERRDGHQRRAIEAECRLIEEELKTAKESRQELQQRLEKLYSQLEPPSIEERLKGKRSRK